VRNLLLFPLSNAVTLTPAARSRVRAQLLSSADSPRGCARLPLTIMGESICVVALSPVAGRCTHRASGSGIAHGLEVTRNRGQVSGSYIGACNMRDPERGPGCTSSPPRRPASCIQRPVRSGPRRHT